MAKEPLFGSPEYERKQEKLIQARKKFNEAAVKRAIVMPNGKISVDGKEMSRSVFMDRYKYSAVLGAPRVVTVSSNPDRTLKPTTKKEIKAEKKSAQLNAKLVKKVDKANYSSNADAARKAAAARAEKVDPKNRTLAQERAIRTASRYKVGLPGFSKGPQSAAAKKEDKEFNKQIKASGKAATAKYKAQQKATAAAKKTAAKTTKPSNPIKKTFTGRARGGSGLRGTVGQIENR